MKKGNQLYINVKITDECGAPLDIGVVKKVQFNIDTITKYFATNSTDVIFEDGIFKVYLTQEETFKMGTNIELEARVLFIDDTILGTKIENIYNENVIKEVILNG